MATTSGQVSTQPVNPIDPDEFGGAPEPGGSSGPAKAPNMVPIGSLEVLDGFVHQWDGTRWYNTGVKSGTTKESNRLGDTINVGGRVMQWDPATSRYSIDLGSSSGPAAAPAPRYPTAGIEGGQTYKVDPHTADITFGGRVPGTYTDEQKRANELTDLSGQRTYNTGERVAGQTFTAGENAAGRQQTSEENALNRALEAGQFSATLAATQRRDQFAAEQDYQNRIRQYAQDKLSAAQAFASQVGAVDPAALEAFYAAGGGNIANALAGGANAVSDNAVMPAARSLRATREMVTPTRYTGFDSPYAAPPAPTMAAGGRPTPPPTTTAPITAPPLPTAQTNLAAHVAPTAANSSNFENRPTNAAETAAWQAGIAGAPSFVTGASETPRYAFGTGLNRTRGRADSNPKGPLDPTQEVLGAHVLSDVGRQALQGTADARLWSQDQYRDQQTRMPSPADPATAWHTPATGVLTTPKYGDKGVSPRVIPHEFAHSMMLSSKVDPAEFTEAVRREIGRDDGKSLYDGLSSLPRDARKSEGGGQVDALRNVGEASDPEHLYTAVVAAYDGRAYLMPPELRKFYPWLAQEETDNSGSPPRYAMGTAVPNPFGPQTADGKIPVGASTKFMSGDSTAADPAAGGARPETVEIEDPTGDATFKVEPHTDPAPPQMGTKPKLAELFSVIGALLSEGDMGMGEMPMDAPRYAYGTDGYETITPTAEDQPYVDEVRSIRNNVQFPMLNPYDTKFRLNPYSQQSRYFNGMQTKYGVPVDDQAQEQQRYQLGGVGRGAYSLGV